MQIVKHDTREHKLMLKVFAHSSKIEKKVMMNVANEINKLKEEDWKGKGVFPIQIPIKDLIERTESSYESIRRICHNIASKIINMEIPYKLKTTGKTAIFKCSVCVFPECGISDSTFRIEVKETVLPLFSRALEVYRYYNIIEAKFLTHKYSIELYKYLKDKLNQNKNEFTVPLNILRAELACENKYELYADFKRRVLEPAKKDMEKNSVLWFDYKEHKRSKSITDLTFFIYTNEEKTKSFYQKEKIKNYISHTPSDKFKEDFTKFIKEKLCVSDISKTVNYIEIECEIKILETKKCLSEYPEEIQIKFIEFIK